MPLYYKNSSFSNNMSNFNDVAGRVFETPALNQVKLFNESSNAFFLQIGLFARNVCDNKIKHEMAMIVPLHRPSLCHKNNNKSRNFFF